MQDRFKLPLKALDDPINVLQLPDKHKPEPTAWTRKVQAATRRI